MQLQDVGRMPFPERPLSCGGGRRAVQGWQQVAVVSRCTGSNSGCIGRSAGAAAVAVHDGVPLRPAPLSMDLSSHSHALNQRLTKAASHILWRFPQRILHIESFTRPKTNPKSKSSLENVAS